MALKRRDVAIAGLVTFIAWGYVTSWLPLLRLLGYAFATGAVLAIGGIGAGIGALILLSTRKSDDVYSRLTQRPQTAAFLTPKAWQAETTWLRNSANHKRKPLYSSSFVISDALDGLLDLVERDVINSWYRNITKSPNFENEVDNTIREALLSIKERLQSVDVAEVLVSRFVPIITGHLKDFYDAEHTVRGKKLNRNVTESEELDMAIATKYQEGKLHSAASLASSDTKLAQQDYLRKLVVRIMPEILPQTMIKSRPVAVLIKEIFACAILVPIMELLSNPDTWNQLMEAYGRTMIQDRKTVRKLRAALDEHASPAPRIVKARQFPKLAPHDDERKFERFIRAIRQCHNLSDARRFRSEVASQLKRDTALHPNNHVYLRRLETGKRILDQRVANLSAVGGSAKEHTIRSDFGNGNGTSRLASATIREVLHDASGLSYFMEYMDRQRLITLVQFWIVVDGFRNPLEEDVPEDDGLSGVPVGWTESDRSDLALIAERYLSRPELRVPQESRDAVSQFLKADIGATPLQYLRARSAVLRAQSAVLEVLAEKHFPNFKTSDLYYKYLTSDESSSKTGGKTLPYAQKPTSVLSRPELVSKSTILPRQESAVKIASLGLQRNATSSHDLKASFIRGSYEDSVHQRQRRSFDLNPSAPLFDDDIEPEALTQSTHSFDSDPAFGEQTNRDEAKMVEAMEAALTNIITNSPNDHDATDSLLDSPSQDLLFGKDTDAFKNLPGSKKDDGLFSEKERERPNLASLGLVNTSSRIGVFTDDDLFGDEDKFIEDEHADPEETTDDRPLEDEIHEAAPGDLGLVEAITALTVDIEKLVAQESVVDTLTRKAELTNNVAELRILGKSKSSLQREIRRKELQRQQYIVQESDNSLYGRATVDIKTIMVGKEEDGQEFALYVIEVQRKAGENMSAASWAVARRYSEFHDLHQRLRMMYPAVRHLDFPGRRIMMKLQKDFLHKRRLALERYLRELLRLPAVCRSRDLRAFLSQHAILSTTSNRDGEGERQDIVSRIYNSVTDGMDEFLGNIPVLDQLSIAGQNLISAATTQYNTFGIGSAPGAGTVPITTATDHPNLSAAEAEAELEAFENHTLEPFVKPICDIFLEVFELNRGQNWRGRAVVVVLHQLLGGTVERKVREMAKSLMQEASVLKCINLAKETMWPGGQLKKGGMPRMEAEKKKSRKEASVMLATLVPDLAGNVVGRANAQAASRRVFAAVNNHRLNMHLAFLLLDEAVAVLFPEGKGRR